MESVGKRVRKTAIYEDNVSDYEPLEAKKRPRKNTTTACRERKNSWNEREDALLRSGVETYGDTSSSWMKIAPLFRGKRDSKQCRERWTEYVNPAHSREPFSAAEDAALVKLQAEYGNSWRVIQVELGKSFSLRSTTRVKSRWYQLYKRSLQGMSSTTAVAAVSPAALSVDKRINQKQLDDPIQGFFPPAPFYLPCAQQNYLNCPSLSYAVPAWFPPANNPHVHQLGSSFVGLAQPLYPCYPYFYLLPAPPTCTYTLE